MKAVLFISHGSRLPKTEDEIRAFVEELKKKTGISVFEYAFLDIMHPSIPEGIDVCVEKGATQIIVLLNFLNAGRHVDEDIPCIVDEARIRHPKVTFHITQPIGQHEKIIDLFLDMITDDGQSQE